jgi:hypothetical protein
VVANLLAGVAVDKDGYRETATVAASAMRNGPSHAQLGPSLEWRQVEGAPDDWRQHQNSLQAKSEISERQRN